MSLEAGAAIGDYQILELLGAGGMGKVYKVRNVISDRVEALKVLLPDLDSNPELADRFLREIKVQASLDHPNIAALHTAVRAENQLLMVMEYVPGETVEAMMRRGPIPLASGLTYIDQVLAALAYAHGRGIVHRDIKPANMMLTPSGTLKLMDFGIARLTIDSRLTQTGRTLGSLFYMSPEQIRGDSALDARSDLYSVGVSLYEIATGRRPFQGDSDYSIMAAHLQQMPVPPAELDPSLPPALSDLILMAMAKDAGQRFQSAEAFRAALSGVSRGIGAPVASAASAAQDRTILFAPPSPVSTVLMPPHVAAPPRPTPIPAPPPVVAHAPAPRSRRGLYMALGSVVTVALLVAAGITLPKLWRTRASGNPVAQTVQPVQTAQLPPTAASNAVAAPPVAQVQEPAPPEAVPQRPQPPARREQAVARTQAPARAIQSREPAANPSAQVASPPAQPVQQAQTPSAAMPAAPTVDLEPLRDRFNKMSSRSDSVLESLDHLAADLRRQGLGLSMELNTARRNLAFHLEEAQRAMQQSDVQRATRQMDAAEQALEKLEQKFGR